ncbi:MAG: DUF2279 domain-containing protein [Candidatus Latescibacteria bacterium]|nr:DUF2279 domain-containing protein [Candidatus Latescibacterota bacterium]
MAYLQGSDSSRLYSKQALNHRLPVAPTSSGHSPLTHRPPPLTHLKAMTRNTASILLLILLTGPIPVTWAQAEKQSGVDFKRLALLGGSAAALRHLGYEYVDRAWYQGHKQDSIRWINDWSGETYVNLDKGGHFIAGLYLSQNLQEAYGWSGFSPRQAALLGTITSWAALLEIEMRDAYFAEWGFSIPDFVANTLGASVPLVHAFFPASQVLNFKFSYFPSSLYLDRRQRQADQRPFTAHAIDDYEGMTFWLTLAVDRVLPKRLAARWPDYMGLALGYSARGLHGSNVKSRGPNKFFPDRPDARPQVLLGLDWDTRQLPGRGPFWRHLKKQLNWIHWPSPALRLYPDLRFYLLYL